MASLNRTISVAEVAAAAERTTRQLGAILLLRERATFL